MAAYFIFLFEFQVKDYLFSHFYVKQLFSAFTSLSKNKQIAHEKLRNTQKNPYCPELPKQKNSCSKMLLFDQLYKKLGYIPLDRSWWPEICQHPNSSDLRNCCCRKTGQATITTKAWNCDDDGKSSEHPPLCGYWPLAFTLEPKLL